MTGASAWLVLRRRWTRPVPRDRLSSWVTCRFQRCRVPIPKQLHIIWVGDESKRPDECIETWGRLNPSYQLRVWGNADLQREPWVMSERMQGWATRELNGLADVMRWEILLRHGGVALDADSICVRPLEDWLLEADAFAAWEQELIRPGLIACGALGCSAANPFIARIMRDIVSDPDPYGERAWKKVGPSRITETWQATGYAGLTIYPSHFFYPDHYTGLTYTGSGTVFARQAWGSTSSDYGRPLRFGGRKKI